MLGVQGGGARFWGALKIVASCWGSGDVLGCWGVWMQVGDSRFLGCPGGWDTFLGVGQSFGFTWGIGGRVSR